MKIVTIKDTYAGGNTKPMTDPILQFIRTTTASGVVEKQPPYCLKQGADITFNRVGSCLYECPVGYDKHKFLECSGEDIKELCCCGECI